ncbi:hypothetical protein AB0368_05770 [Actinoplanes sp. NPDC051475]|uniref:hypothetical protein n=1 Tax=Actinoplanes sp. NPDC051475 TaxID=3157225 RepID=UPI00344B0585
MAHDVAGRSTVDMPADSDLPIETGLRASTDARVDADVPVGTGVRVDAGPSASAVRQPPEKLVERARPDAGEAGMVRWLHRGLTLAAIMGLVVGTRAFWNAHALTRPGLAFALTCAYLVMLIAAILALCLSSSRSLARLDVAVLGTAMAVKVIGGWPSLIGEKAITVDEGMLMDGATRSLAAGHNPYLSAWTGIDPVLPTQLMDGRTVYDFGYPPFGAELGALAQRLLPSVPGIVVVAWLALLATAALIFLAAPTPLRPLATLGVLGLGTLTSYANNAYPSLIALPFLCLAVWGWTAIGRGGRLGRGGILRAVALGLACSTHQLGWFVALFLTVGLVVLRRGEMPLRAAIAVVARYVVVALSVFVLVSAWFIATSPQAWLTGILEPMLQHAVPHGQGIMGLSSYVIGGSGALDFYGHASMLLLVALLITFAVHLRTLGPAAVVLPWLVFMVSTRSQDGYWVLTMPLWIVALVTTTRSDFAGAHRFRIPGRLGGQSAANLPAGRARIVGVLATAALFLPAVACVAVAVATPQPLDLRVPSAVSRSQPVRTLTVQVINRSSGSITPHFAVATDVTIAEYWKVDAGPQSLPPHGSATYTLSPQKTWKAPADGPAFLRVVSDHPQTLSSLRLLR